MILQPVAIVFSIELTFDEYKKITDYDASCIKKNIDNFSDTMINIPGVDNAEYTGGGHVEITVNIEMGGITEIHNEILKVIKEIIHD